MLVGGNDPFRAPQFHLVTVLDITISYCIDVCPIYCTLRHSVGQHVAGVIPQRGMQNSVIKIFSKILKMAQYTPIRWGLRKRRSDSGVDAQSVDVQNHGYTISTCLTHVAPVACRDITSDHLMQQERRREV